MQEGSAPARSAVSLSHQPLLSCRLPLPFCTENTQLHNSALQLLIWLWDSASKGSGCLEQQILPGETKGSEQMGMLRNPGGSRVKETFPLTPVEGKLCLLSLEQSLLQRI